MLTRDGEPLVRRAVRLALMTMPRRCVVVLGADAARVEPLLQDMDVEIVFDPDWRQGMDSSLACLRHSVQDDPDIVCSLVLGCDQPALEAAHLCALLDAASQSSSGCATAGYEGMRGIPLVVAQLALRRALLRGNHGLRSLFVAMEPQRLACITAPALALDIDTPRDVDAARSRGWLDPE